MQEQIANANREMENLHKEQKRNARDQTLAEIKKKMDIYKGRAPRRTK